MDCTSDNVATDHLYIMYIGPTSISVLLSQLGGDPVYSNHSQRSSPRRAEAVVSSRQLKEAALVSCLIESCSHYSRTVAQLQWASLSRCPNSAVLVLIQISTGTLHPKHRGPQLPVSSAPGRPILITRKAHRRSLLPVQTLGSSIHSGGLPGNSLPSARHRPHGPDATRGKASETPGRAKERFHSALEARTGAVGQQF